MAKDDLQLLRLRLPRQVTRMTEDGRSATDHRSGSTPSGATFRAYGIMTCKWATVLGFHACGPRFVRRLSADFLPWCAPKSMVYMGLLWGTRQLFTPVSQKALIEKVG
jgi:hypothetical protein